MSLVADWAVVGGPLGARLTVGPCQFQRTTHIRGGFVAALLAIPAAGALQVLVREVWQAAAPPPDPELTDPSGPDDPVIAPGELFPVPPDTREHGS